MSGLRIGVAGIRDPYTTAVYYLSAADAGHRASSLHRVDDDACRNLDLLIVVDPFLQDLRALRKLRCPSVGVLIDVHRTLDMRLAFARYLDHVMVAQPAYVDAFKADGHDSVHWLPLGCDPDVHFSSGLTRDIDVGFVGKMGAPGTDRNETLTRVLSAFRTNDTQRSYLPREMGETYSRSKIVFNKSIGGDLNMRFFEALGAGALLVTDRIGNGLAEIGREGEHFVLYDTADEAIEKITFYLRHEAERAAIARAGQALAFERHTYAHRLQQILDTVAANAGAMAPARVAPSRQERLWRSEFMRRRGAGPGEFLQLVADGHASRAALSNGMIGVARHARGVARRAAASLKGQA